MWGKLEKMPRPQEFSQDDPDYQIVGMGEVPPDYVVQHSHIEIPGLRGSAEFYHEIKHGKTGRIVRQLQRRKKSVAASFDYGTIKLYVSNHHPELLTAVAVGGVMVAGAVYLIEKRKKRRGGYKK